MTQRNEDLHAALQSICGAPVASFICAVQFLNKEGEPRTTWLYAPGQGTVVTVGLLTQQLVFVKEQMRQNYLRLRGQENE